MNLIPYVFFYGRCDEALEFYKSALGGSFEATRIGDSPMREQAPPERHNAIMHATFKASGLTFYASDGQDLKAIDPDEGNVSLCISTEDKSQADRIFAALAAGGKVTMPLGDAFWGGRFGVLQDKFGIEWFVESP